MSALREEAVAFVSDQDTVFYTGPAATSDIEDVHDQGHRACGF